MKLFECVNHLKPATGVAGNGYCFDCGLEKAHHEANHPESEGENPTPESQPSTD